MVVGLGLSCVTESSSADQLPVRVVSERPVKEGQWGLSPSVVLQDRNA